MYNITHIVYSECVNDTHTTHDILRVPMISHCYYHRVMYSQTRTILCS